MNFFYLLLVIFTFISSYLITPKIINFAKNRKIFDEPNYRKKHYSPIPRIGGLGIFFSLTISFSILFLFDKSQIYIQNQSYILFIFVCFLSIFILGFVDDLKSISPFFRLILQFFISTIAWFQLVKIKGLYFYFTNLDNFFNIDSNFISYLFTVFWIVAVINAINWIDGMDGLLIGLTCIYSFTFFVINYLNNNFIDALVSIIMFSACLGFLKFNKYPAKIMTGDGGSYLLGFYLSISVLTCGKSPGIVNPFLITSLLLWPLIDMLRVIIVRILNRKSPFFPDRNHLHYLLVDSGMNQKKCLYIIFFISILMSFLNIVINFKFQNISLPY
ncbi:putative UDP-N-acetylglucosamine-1-phosphate transferase [Prochlorococcus marinus str. MIT 9312]|uniref:Putative UDP-N-acetylglucosamine-1-phosphate transferase n=1 Tax=Prochlorococcus marinus (strain MIT 9312) TaxID=74546 RepID=Q319R7_PROM9|nr:MraY family glycosyltransferase [Prochlorococcus marinus]ABB50378.1 putative UDP-N-acetylglucosamine-1-phosphate transferase [Prochlorococcus marinus str. MIT 9312]KGF99972.1 Undecaprenyl-phosphate N-acetylglucosaminyl 1-phosphate transferase [Prochlorococcus marinus str. MIT 9311]